MTLTGTGVATSTATLSATSLDFGTQKVVARSTTQSFTLINSTAQPIYTGSIAVGGANASDFRIGSDCPTNLLVGSSCNVYVVFTPMFAGSRSASLTVPVDSSGSQTNIALTASGSLPVHSRSSV